MKNKIMTIVLSAALGFLAFPAVSDIVSIHGWHPFFAVPSYGLTEAFDHHCTKDIVKNGHGWVFVEREYFACGKINIFISDRIYGEYSHPQTAKELKALKDFQDKANREELESKRE